MRQKLSKLVCTHRKTPDVQRQKLKTSVPFYNHCRGNGSGQRLSTFMRSSDLRRGRKPFAIESLWSIALVPDLTRSGIECHALIAFSPTPHPASPLIMLTGVFALGSATMNDLSDVEPPRGRPPSGVLPREGREGK